jgi:hypothetical protein
MLLHGKVISNVETERLMEEDVVACCKVTANNYFDRLRKAMKNTSVAGNLAGIQNNSSYPYYYTSLLYIYSIGNNTAHSKKILIICVSF